MAPADGACAQGVGAGAAHDLRGSRRACKGEPRAAEGLPHEAVAAYPETSARRTCWAATTSAGRSTSAAIAAYEKATAIDPAFSQPYNQMGYAYRFLGQYDEAEKAFKKYIELIPNDPNPYDSYAELLMKMGRFEESIRSYEKALAVDPNFVASYVGIGNDQMFMGQPAEAARPSPGCAQVARNDGERRAGALLDGDVVRARGRDRRRPLAEVEKNVAIDEAGRRPVALSGDLNLMGDILLEAGRVDAARRSSRSGWRRIEKADVRRRGQGGGAAQRALRRGAVALAATTSVAAKAKAADGTRRGRGQEHPVRGAPEPRARGPHRARARRRYASPPPSCARPTSRTRASST